MADDFDSIERKLGRMANPDLPAIAVAAARPLEQTLLVHTRVDKGDLVASIGHRVNVDGTVNVGWGFAGRPQTEPKMLARHNRFRFDRAWFRAQPAMLARAGDELIRQYRRIARGKRP